MDLLKALQREGYVRIERDRRGGLRVFQGSKLQNVSAAPPIDVLPQPDVEETDAPAEAAVVEIHADEPLVTPEPGDAEPMPIDTTAELLGRATKRKPRTSRLPRALAASSPKRAGAKKAPTRRTRGKKAAADADDPQS